MRPAATIALGFHRVGPTVNLHEHWNRRTGTCSGIAAGAFSAGTGAGAGAGNITARSSANHASPFHAGINLRSSTGVLNTGPKRSSRPSSGKSV